MNVAMGVRTPAAVLTRAGRRETQKTVFARFLDGLKKSRRHEARLVIARHIHLLPSDHPWRRGRHGVKL
jgi:hypothetical protein